MPCFVARQRAESSLRFLHEKTNGMEPFHVANHVLVLRDYVTYLERDEVLAAVVDRPRRHLTTTAKAYCDQAVRTNVLPPLPADPIACFAFRWDFMRQVKLEKVDLRYFASCFYPGEHLNAKLMYWKQAIVHPFATDARRLANRLLERLPPSERLDIEALVDETLPDFAREAFGPRAWTAEDEERPTEPVGRAPPLAPPEPTLEEAVEALGRALEAAPIAEDVRHDLALDARILLLEARRRAPERARLEARLAGFAPHRALDALVEQVKKRLP